MAERQTEQVHPLGKGLHRQPAQAVLSAVLVTQEQALAKLHACLPDLERAADLAAEALLAGGKLAYAGAGSSGLMALADCLELAGTFGIPREQTPMLFAGGAAALLAMTGGVEDDVAQAMTDVVNAGIGAGDVVLCLAASGSTPYTVAVATAARSAGARVIGLANIANAPLYDLSDISVLLETGPEVVAGSTRLGAATAQKAALNMISVLVGVRLGAVHDGQMVNLIADNIKLVDRAARIVARIAGTGEEAARVALHHTNGAVKPAILVARGQSADAALQALAASGGKLAPYLD
ncbi:MAG: hypothetical protein RL472_943 [Pseudomonadota bacterium]|jgi:N-acetylmuramic acid 6-phosphate etherase